MSEEIHRAAGHLILKERVEGISAAEQEWLGQHLAECPECARAASGAADVLAALRAVSVPVPAGLAARTQLRLYLHRREKRRGGWVPWTACGISWALGILSAPYIWRGFRWLGDSARLPEAVWKMGFVMWWALPALLAAGALLVEWWGKEGTGRPNDVGL